MTQNSRVIGPLICSLRLVNRSGLQRDLSAENREKNGTKLPKLAENPPPKADSRAEQIKLADFYANFYGDNWDSPKAIRLYEQAAKSPEQAFDLIREMSEKNPMDPHAALWLAQAYEEGRGIRANPRLAFVNYLNAASLGKTALALRKTAECFASGYGTDKNLESAAANYLAAANAGDPESMYQYAECCYYGRGVPESPELAAEWYQKAADCGHVRAQHDLGMCYLYGLGTKRDRKKGKALLTQAEENGYSE